MNELIKQIAGQAGFVVAKIGLVSGDFNVKTSNGTDVDADLEKFAELIVKDCQGMFRGV